ncbi:MAG: hypothetical protein NUK65_09545, partial [Firmicutes bacterium]|nr:hypothetical protein [Bacillota bacterium]
MNKLLTLPFFCQGQTSACLLQIRSDGTLISEDQAEDTKTITLLANCKCFDAAAEKNGTVHILAATEENRLVYFLLEGDDVKEIPFITTEAPAHFTLGVDHSGRRYYCGQGDGKLDFAVLGDAMKWQRQEFSIGQQPAPLAMAIDHANYAHFLSYDVNDFTLSYFSVEPKNFQHSSPFQLSTSLQLRHNPALLYDSVKNIHIAWVSEQDNLLHYQARLAGGWPVGGWQHELAIPLQFLSQMLSFTEVYPHPEIWLLDDRNLIHYISPTDEAEQKPSSPVNNKYPARIGKGVTTELRMITQNEDTSLLTNALKVLQEDTHVQPSVQEEDDSPLFLHARRLMAEKKRLEYELSKKEATVAQFRHMLDLSQENVRKQTILLNEKLSGINKKVKELQEKNNSLALKCEELQHYQENFTTTQKMLEQTEAATREQRVQLSRLRNDLVLALQRDKEQIHKIKALEEELANKKGVWDTVTSLFQKNT